MRIQNFVLPEKLFARLKDYSKNEGLSMSDVVRRAIEEYIDRRESGILILREDKVKYHVEESKPKF